AKTEVTVNSGAVTVTGAGLEVKATGIRASAENGGTVEVKTGEVTSNATNDNTQGLVYGISADGKDGGTVTVSTGAVSASGVNVTEAIYAYTSGDSSTVTVNTGTLNSSASGSTSNGIYTINEGGSMVVTTGAVTSTSTAKYAGALGAQIKATGGTTTVNTGLITAESNNQTAGVSIDSAGSSTLVNVTTGSIEVLKGETSGIRVWAHDNGSLEMDVNGNVNSSGTGIWVRCDSQNSEAVVKVTEDVIAGDTAVDLTKTNNTSTTTIEVDGTISGKEHNIVITEDSATKGIDITVWKVDTSGEKEVIEQKDGMEYFVPENAAEIVNYIIKVEGNL
ncbi:hypothetical protein BXO88_16190, partial [Oribacterium sp. C9]|uniref:hypothetical protein n=1 Tax=Oribacterium sp. C9 TaxID=1943579 RepID=UPI0009D4B80B